MFDISVIVPIYNVEEYLEACLESLLRQGSVRLQVIMIDDGSTDTSGAIARKYEEQYDGFEYHLIPNGGLGHARNVGVPYAKGKYLIFIDSDDVVEDKTYQRMFEKAEQDGSQMTICYVDRFNSNGHWVSNLHEKVFRRISSPTHIKENNDLIYDTTSWNKLILRSFYLETGLSFPENILYEDIPVTIPLHYMANRVSVVQNAGYYWRVRDGVSKSITQNTDQIQNLKDRVRILRMLDKFFDSHVDDENLKAAKQTKALSVDLMIFVNQCAKVPRDVAYKYFDVINEYIDEAVDEGTFSSLRLLDQQKYRHVRKGDLDALLNLISYTQYNDAPIREVNERLIADLPSDFFEESPCDITAELGKYLPIQTVDKMALSESGLSLDLFIYRNRVNIFSSSDQSVKAWLFQETTGQIVQIRTDSFKASKATGDLGVITEKHRSISTQYSYDGCGCRLHIDFKDQNIMNLSEGDYNILLEVENRFYNDRFLLSPNGRTFQNGIGSSILSGGSVYSVACSNPKRFILRINRTPVLLNDYRFDGHSLRLKIEGCSSVAAKVGSKLVPLNAISDDEVTHEAVSKDYVDGEQCNLVAMDANGHSVEERPVYLVGKVFNIIESHGSSCIVSNLGNNAVKFTFAQRPVIVRRITGKKGLYIISAELNHYCSLKSARIVINDEIGGKEVLLSRALVRNRRNGMATLQFLVNLWSNRLTEDLYAGKRLIYVVLYDANGREIKKPIYCAPSCSKKVLHPMLTVTLQRSLYGLLQINAGQRWGEGEGSYKRRKRLIAENYPLYMQEDIDQHLILFESMWGKNYSCNPSALYEYIDEHCPEYKCVWSLRDPKTPIPGRAKRVRKDSLEYYHYLATAKYLVNNVNFVDDYIKRDGQIEIQTMHGTPLKTLGLDVSADFGSEASIERYIAKNRRWDYIIVQGTFMEERVEGCFGVTPEVLRTGYPRTDVLMNVSEEKVITLKQKLGLPLDKKVILYAPTWRKKGGFDLKLDINQLKDNLSGEYVLVTKFHHYSIPVSGLYTDNDFSYDLSLYHSIEDLYCIADIMITDYSSTMFDYALLNRPMVFYVYDYESYKDELRGMYVDFEEEAPGPLVDNMNSLIAAIKSIDEEMEKHNDRIMLFKEKYLTYESACSSEAIVNQVFRKQH